MIPMPRSAEQVAKAESAVLLASLRRRVRMPTFAIGRFRDRRKERNRMKALHNRESAQPASTPGASSPRIERGAWLALTAALLGWMFDGAEMGVFSLVGRPAIKDLLQTANEGQIALWLGVITAGFLIGAATGGVLFGWLGDRIGRVRAMTLSVLCYALFTSLGGFAQSPLQLGLLRFIAALGMGGEWSLGVALVMEVFPNRSRAYMAGLIGAAANVGYLLVGMVGLALNSVIHWLEATMTSAGLPQWLIANDQNQGWRVIMILGIVPAGLTFFIRLFVPESHKWEEERKTGSTANWATVDLLGVLIGACGPALMVYVYAFPATAGFEHTTALRVVVTIAGLAMAIGGYLFPVIRYLYRMEAGSSTRAATAAADSIAGSTIRRMLLAACLSGVALLGTWGATQQAPAWANKLTEAQKKIDGIERNAKEYMLIWLSVGAIVGTIGAALMGDWLGRRRAYFLLCVLAYGSVILLFHGNRDYGPMMLFCAFLAGTCSASFYGWLPLYLPELFRTRVRATGQGFGFNFGRIIAAVGSLQLGNLVAYFADGLTIGPWHMAGGYPTACTLLSLIYVVGMVIIWFAPETRGQPLPD
jgi:SHS family sialic acid transporter-like MFS transporter